MPHTAGSLVGIFSDNDPFQEILERKCIEEMRASEFWPPCEVAFVEFADRDSMQGFSEWSLVSAEY